jgi:fructose-bisphosphate aldolase, class I
VHLWPHPKVKLIQPFQELTLLKLFPIFMSLIFNLINCIDMKNKQNNTEKIMELLGKDEALLFFDQPKISRERLYIPGPNSIDDVFGISDRNINVLVNLSRIYNHGRLSGTGYLSVLPVDQGIEHTAGSSFAPNPDYFDPENIINLAIEGGCNAVATTFGGFALHARRYAHKIPFIVKLNHNELLTHPNKYDQVMFGAVKEAWNLGAAAVGATIYFGSKESNRQLTEVAEAFETAHELGMATILWCYLRNGDFKTKEQDYHTAADLTGQANHLGVTIKADIIKQKLPTCNGGFSDLKFGKTHPDMYKNMVSDNPIDLCRYQVANCYMGKIGLINSGGASSGSNDFAEAARTAVINKRAGGYGLISGRKAFQRPMAEGVELLNLIQDVYLNDAITVA